MMARPVAAQQREHWEQDHAGRRGWDHPSVRALFEPRAEDVAQLMGGDGSASVLDVGCGNGFLTMPLEQRFGRVVGLDFSASMLAINPAKEKVQGDACKLPFPDGAFDAVVSSHMLHHMDQDQQSAAVREMARVARRLVVIWEPNRGHPAMLLFGALVPHERELLRFSAGRLRDLMTAAGLNGVAMRREGLITPNLCPAAVAPVARALGATALRGLGMYVRAIGWKRSGAEGNAKA
jgi:SAM-dependent methyltransferase